MQPFLRVGRVFTHVRAVGPVAVFVILLVVEHDAGDVWVFRPRVEMSATCMRIMMPPVVEIMRSSVSRTPFMATSSPVRDVAFIVMMPFPPRVCVL